MSECTACPQGTDECAHRDGAWVRRQGWQVIVDSVDTGHWEFDFSDERQARGCFAAFEKKLRTGKDTIRVLS